MTKQEVEQKIKEILSKDKKFDSVKVSIKFKDKSNKKRGV
jgi:hypothetical protein